MNQAIKTTLLKHNIEGSAEVYVGEHTACVMWTSERWTTTEDDCDTIKNDLKDVGDDRDWLECVGFDTEKKGRFIIEFKALISDPYDAPEYELVSATDYETICVNSIIARLFEDLWTDDLRKAPIIKQRKQVYKNLKNQVDGYWTGHTAYQLLLTGGFIIDGKPSEKKRLTYLGQAFMNDMEKNNG